MNKVTFYFILSIATLSIFSCSKNDSVTYTPPIAYSVQYPKDIETIEEYLNNYYFDVTNDPGQPDDQDIVISKITDATTQRSIMSYLDAPTYPKLLIRPVRLHDVDYKLYYLVVRPGVGESPCNVDGVLTAYRGEYLYKAVSTNSESVLTVNKFEEVKFPQSFLSLYTTIPGWSEILPQFKKGTYTEKTDGTITYEDFGVGAMFLPSGLAYYNSSSGIIPSYSPLVFSFKLYEIQRLDQDNDGIPSYLEDRNGDNYMYSYANTISYPTTPTDAILYADDTDNDGIPNFLDVDDDGDNYTTKLEIIKGTDYLDRESHP